MSPHSLPYHSQFQWSLIDGNRYKIQRHILSEIFKSKFSVQSYPATFHRYGQWNRPISPNFPKHRQRGHIAQRTHCCRDTNQFPRGYPQHHPTPKHRLHQHIRDKFGFHALSLCYLRLLFNIKGTRNLIQISHCSHCQHQQGNPWRNTVEIREERNVLFAVSEAHTVSRFKSIDHNVVSAERICNDNDSTRYLPVCSLSLRRW